MVPIFACAPAELPKQGREGMSLLMGFPSLSLGYWERTGTSFEKGSLSHWRQQQELSVPRGAGIPPGCSQAHQSLTVAPLPERCLWLCSPWSEHLLWHSTVAPCIKTCIDQGKKNKSLVHAMKRMGRWAARSQGQTQPSPLQPCMRLWNNVPFFIFSCLKSVLVILYKLQQFLCERPEAQPKVEREVQLLRNWPQTLPVSHTTMAGWVHWGMGTKTTASKASAKALI